MNLVAKEYIASQNPADPGVLVLSQFAGAAQELANGAVIVNPYDIEDMAGKLADALAMPLEERQSRYEAMIGVLKRNDIFLWAERFTDLLLRPDASFGDEEPDFVIASRSEMALLNRPIPHNGSASLM
jgi:trehalose 6-phosphate synthase